MILLALACTPKTPPKLFPKPVPVAEIEEVDAGRLPEGDECTEGHPVDAGGEAPCSGVLVPPTGPESFAAYLEHQRRDWALTDAYSTCVDHRELDRALAQDRFGTCDQERHELNKREGGLRLAVPVAFVGGVAVGAGVVFGLARAFLAGLER